MSIVTTLVFGRTSSPRRLCGAIVFGAAVLTAAALPIPPAVAHEYKVGAIEIGHPWSRATPPSATIGAGYLTLTNEGSEPDRLIGLTSPAAPKVEIHEMSVEGDVMRMKPVEGGIEIPAGGTVALEPGGNHLMLTGLAKPLVEGERVPLTLVFEKAGSIDVELAVDKLGVTAPTQPVAHDAVHGAGHAAGHEAGQGTGGEAAHSHGK